MYYNFVELNAVIRGNGFKLMFFLLLQCPCGCAGCRGWRKATPPKPPCANSRRRTLGNATPYREQSANDLFWGFRALLFRIGLKGQTETKTPPQGQLRGVAENCCALVL